MLMVVIANWVTESEMISLQGCDSFNFFFLIELEKRTDRKTMGIFISYKRVPWKMLDCKTGLDSSRKGSKRMSFRKYSSRYSSG